MKNEHYFITMNETKYIVQVWMYHMEFYVIIKFKVLLVFIISEIVISFYAKFFRRSWKNVFVEISLIFYILW